MILPLLVLGMGMGFTTSSLHGEPSSADRSRQTGLVHDTTRSPFLLKSHGSRFGDPFPVHWDGVWHLYSMSEDATKVLHFTSTDLVKWEEHEPAMTGKDIATGTIVRHKGKYYLFYTDAARQTIRLVVSDRPWEFDFRKSQQVAEADGRTYQKGWFRDAYVFYREDENLWWMLFEGRCPEVCTGLLKSADLLHWTMHAPIFKDRARQFGSCPQVFKQGKFWYLAVQDLGNWYYSAESPYGPWTNRGQYLSAVVEAASRFATEGKRQVAWGWACDWTIKPRIEIRGYGGPLSIGREMVFAADGTMGVRPLPELLSAIRGKACKIDLTAARKLSGAWKLDAAERTLQCGKPGGTVLLEMPGKNPDYYFEADLELSSPLASANIAVRSSEAADRGYGFALSPADKRISICAFDSRSDRVVLNDKEYAFPAKGKVNFQVFVCGDLMEAFVDSQASLSARVNDRSRHQVAITIAGGSATIRKPLLHYFDGLPGRKSSER